MTCPIIPQQRSHKRAALSGRKCYVDRLWQRGFWGAYRAKAPGNPGPAQAATSQTCQGGATQGAGPIHVGQPGGDKEGRQAARAGGPGQAHIADLVLGLLDPLEFGRICHHAEASALVLLKLLLVAHLGTREIKRD